MNKNRLTKEVFSSTGKICDEIRKDTVEAGLYLSDRRFKITRCFELRLTKSRSCRKKQVNGHELK